MPQLFPERVTIGMSAIIYNDAVETIPMHDTSHNSKHNCLWRTLHSCRTKNKCHSVHCRQKTLRENRQTYKIKHSNKRIPYL